VLPRSRAARALHIHPNTLLYRARRFEQVSGCSPGSTESLAEVWLALRATAAVPDVAKPPSTGLGFHDS
jgi:DNA-binding PucR family transcriptional regulator